MKVATHDEPVLLLLDAVNIFHHFLLVQYFQCFKEWPEIEQQVEHSHTQEEKFTNMFSSSANVY